MARTQRALLMPVLAGCVSGATTTPAAGETPTISQAEGDQVAI